MTVILVAAERYDRVRKTMRHLREQTMADRLEVLLIVPALEAGNETEQDAAPFLHFERIAAGPIHDVDKATAFGIDRARAPIVALVEDHAFPEPDWAEALILAHAAGPWSVVGSVVENANPDTSMSWSNQLLAYGEWTEPVRGGAIGSVSRHNVSFKTDVLRAYGDALPDYLGRAGGLLEDLKRRGNEFYLERAARIRHVNPSRFGSSVALRFYGGRLSSASRARSWPPARRLGYAAASPLIPLVRCWRLAPKLLARGRAGLPLWPAFLISLALDGAGQMLGFAFGPGDTERWLVQFEKDRPHHLTEHDRRLLAA